MTPYKKYKRRGLCYRCGKKKDAVSSSCHLCEICRKKKNKASNKIRAYKKRHRLCRDCGSKLVRTDNLLCERCKEKARIAQLKRTRRYAKAGLCKHCRNVATLRDKSKVCENCWFKATALTATRSGKDGPALKAIIEKQNYTCVYSGLPLVLGKNAHVDHIIPVSRGGLRHISNVQWLDAVVNRMKQNLTESEFLEYVKLIARRNRNV